MAFIRRHINILFVLILPVYFYIVQNTIQNKHTHVYANGVVVTHAHPVDKENGLPISQHEHTKQEICLYSSLHIDLYLSPEPLSYTSTTIEIPVQYLLSNENPDSFAFYENSIPRAPPV